MKYFLVLACLAVVIFGLPPGIEEKIKLKIVGHANNCKEETGATDDDCAPMKKHEPPTTQKGKCFLACISKKFGFQNEAGKKDKEGALAVIEKIKPMDEGLYGKGKEVIDICFGEVSDSGDECETATNLYICSQREMKAREIKPIEF